jgi:hypothetical protein
VTAKTSQRTQLTPANRITEDQDDKIRQHQQVREVTEQKRTKEEQADIHKAQNLKLSSGAVTNTGDFEFSLLLGEIKYHLASLYPKMGDGGKV